MYVIRRHGGTGRHQWRTVCQTENREAAMAAFDRIKLDMRQGGLVLEEDGKVIREYSAPLVRTRW